MNSLEAYKMDGLGNDFIIFDRRKKSFSLTKDQIIKISKRDNVGCDQVIFINNDESNDDDEEEDELSHSVMDKLKSRMDYFGIGEIGTGAGNNPFDVDEIHEEV